jgi:hypothetical protein
MQLTKTRTIPALMIAMGLLGLSLFPRTGLTQTTQRSFEVLAFDKGGDHFLLKIDDPGVGILFQVRMTFQGRLVEEKMAPMGHEEGVQKALLRKHKLSVEPVTGQETPDKKHVLMGFKDRDHYRLFVMKGDRVGYYDRIELKKDREGKTGDAYMKEVYWTPNGKRFVVILHQTLASTDDRIDYDTDFFYVFKFKRYKIRFGGDGET